MRLQCSAKSRMLELVSGGQLIDHLQRRPRGRRRMTRGRNDLLDLFRVELPPALVLFTSARSINSTGFIGVKPIGGRFVLLSIRRSWLAARQR